ncbi:MAG: DNA-processing protein DprA [Acidobacteria bacterium]|nr:DNA-processing protein DprA [Acidobacteriota bacterium]
MPEPRQLLIAVNARDDLDRAAVCRLAQELDAWSNAKEPPERLARRLGVPAAQLCKALDVIPRAETLAKAESDRADDLGARLVTCLDDEYPTALRDLHLPPPVLYIQGELPAGPAVAVVGSRKATDYGLEAAAFLGRSLAETGLTVVSGFARGVDAAAHRGALTVSGGRTVAVLGTGIDILYPRGHTQLGRAIAASGARISEFPVGWLPRPWSFPIRNRLIAALARGTVVVEAAARSGSLITAHHALELGREVFAIPGRIFDDKAQGPNGLIRDGATLVQHPADVLDALGLGRLGFGRGRSEEGPGQTALPAPPAPTETRPLPGGLAGKLLEHLPAGTRRSPDDLAMLTGTSMDQVLGELLELELQGWLRRHPGPLYGRGG